MPLVTDEDGPHLLDCPCVIIPVPCDSIIGLLHVWCSRLSSPLAYQVILELGIGQFREFERRRVHTRIISLGLFLVHELTCGKRESVS